MAVFYGRSHQIAQWKNYRGPLKPSGTQQRISGWQKNRPFTPRNSQHFLNFIQPSALPLILKKRLDEAFRVIRKFMDARSVCIFLQEASEAYTLRYHSGDHTGLHPKRFGPYCTVGGERPAAYDRPLRWGKK